MRACASASGGVMFIPEKIERKIPVLKERKANDNQSKEESASSSS